MSLPKRLFVPFHPACGFKDFPLRRRRRLRAEANAMDMRFSHIDRHPGGYFRFVFQVKE